MQVHFGDIVPEAGLLLRTVNTLLNPRIHRLTPLNVGSKDRSPYVIPSRASAKGNP
jgi:hypothetical protein